MSAKELVSEPAAGPAKASWRSRLVTLAAGGAAVAYALFVFVPVQQSIAATRKTIREQRARISQGLTLAQSIRDAEEKLASTEQFVKSWRTKAPAASQLAMVFAEIMRCANEHEAEVTSLTPQAEQPLQTIGLVPVALQAQGSYRSLHGMLQSLGGMSGVVWIEDLQLRPADGQPDALNCTMKLIIFANRGEISG